MRYEHTKRLIEATILLVMLAVMPLIAETAPVAFVLGYMALFVFLLRQFIVLCWEIVG